jgi:hypothetical protein
LKNSDKFISILRKLSSATWQEKAFFFMLLGILVSACKDDNEIGINVLPPSDQIGTAYSDTSTIISSTIVDDSLRTDELSLQLLGSDNDPVFGLTTASVFTQVTLEGTPAFADSIKADSLVLSLTYFNYYGDTTQPQTINVYRMAEPMYADSSYYSDRIFQYNPVAIGTWTGPFQPKTNVIVNNAEAVPQIRITLDQNLADSLLTINGMSNSSWLDYFKGLYLESAPNANHAAIGYFNFYYSAMTLYFHDSTSSYSYNFSLKDARLNHYTHDFAGSVVETNIGSQTDTVNYLLAMGGLKTKISFPFLKHFTDSGSILINKAELQISARTGSANSALPSKLVLVTRDGTGAIVFPVDYYEASGYYGGNLTTSGDGYTFNITRQIQQYLDGTVTNTDFILTIAGGGVEASRAVLRSQNSGDLKMKFIISYTKTN